MNISKYKRLSIFKVKGTPVYIGWSLYPIAILGLFGVFNDPSFLVGALCWWGMMLLHELGHYYLAKKNNLDVLEIQLNLLHGYCLYEESSYAYINYIVAWGGVLFQILVAVPFMIILPFFSGNAPWFILLPLVIFGPISFITALSNLAPTHPLDGATCWKAIPIFLKKRNKNSKKRKFNIVK